MWLSGRASGFHLQYQKKRKKKTWKHQITSYLLKISDRTKIVGKKITCRGIKRSATADFSLQTTWAWQVWRNIFRVLGGKLLELTLGKISKVKVKTPRVKQLKAVTQQLAPTTRVVTVQAEEMVPDQSAGPYQRCPTMAMLTFWAIISCRGPSCTLEKVQ